MAAPIPDAMSYEQAAVLPLGLSTAACGLFQRDYLALSYPSLSPAPRGKTLLVWGGSTSVGSNAIQLAVAAGYEVITTSSPKNFAYCRKLGAAEVFDYRSPSAIADVVRAFEGRTCAGALAIGLGSVEACLDVVHACKGDKFVAIATPSVSFANATNGAMRALWLVPTLGRLMAANVVKALKSQRGQIRSKFIFGSTLVANEVGGLIYRDFLPGALAQGRYVAAPDPIAVGRGLDRIEAGLEMLRGGVSARKVVVSL